MMCTKHKFFDSPADTQPSYREVSRYSTNSVLNTQQQMNQHGNRERRASMLYVMLISDATLVPLIFRAEKGGNE